MPVFGKATHRSNSAVGHEDAFCLHKSDSATHSEPAWSKAQHGVLSEVHSTEDRALKSKFVNSMRNRQGVLEQPLHQWGDPFGKREPLD